MYPPGARAVLANNCPTQDGTQECWQTVGFLDFVTVMISKVFHRWIQQCSLVMFATLGLQDSKLPILCSTWGFLFNNKCIPQTLLQLLSCPMSHSGNYHNNCTPFNKPNTISIHYYINSIHIKLIFKKTSALAQHGVGNSIMSSRGHTSSSWENVFYFAA